MRGLDLTSVVIFVAAIGDLGRFSMCRQLRAYRDDQHGPDRYGEFG
jgi:hypothetical protein